MRLSIPTKIFIAFSGVILTFTIVLMLGIWRSQKLNTQNQALNQSIVPLSLLLSDAQNDIKSLNVALSESDPARLAQTLQRVSRVSLVSVAPKHASSKLIRARSMSQRDAFNELAEPEQAKIAQVRDRLSELITIADALDQKTRRLSRRLTTLATSSSPISLDIQSLREETRRDTETLDVGISRLRNDLRMTSDVTLLRMQVQEREYLYILGLMNLIALTVSLMLLAVALRIVQPLRPLTAGVKRIATGDYTPLPPSSSLLGKDELLTLTEEFNFMARALSTRDETLKAQHAALLRSERLATIGRMTSLITHEVRNPLSSIGLNAEMLQDSLREIDSDEQDELIALLDTITDEVDRLSDITEEYLVYARHPDPRPTIEDVTSIVEQLIDFHTWEWGQLDVQIDFDQDTPRIEANVDANQLRQALLNLIKNAVEVSPQGSSVIVALKDIPGHVQISVRDQGPGIPEETREHIFEPFFTDKEQGTGLGLPMTLQIVEQHHGNLTVESSPEQGACFTITLPDQGPVHVPSHPDDLQHPTGYSAGA